MTSQIPDQMPLPAPPAAAAPAPDGARHCKQPGCGAELPAATGRGAPRLFCSPACSRKWHNENRLAPAAAGQQRAPAAGGPLAGLQQLLAQAADLAGAAAAQLAAADPGRVTATLAAADAARRQAQAETGVALAQAAGAVQAEQAATAAMHAARHDAQAALEAADAARADADAADIRAQAIRDQADAQITEIRRQADTALAAAREGTRAAHADRDTALSAADQARHHASTEIGRARQAEADARAENDHVRADAARERDAAATACTAQLHALQALADTWRARAEHAEQQLDLERDHQRRLAAQLSTATATGGNGDADPAAPAVTRPAPARATAGVRVLLHAAGVLYADETPARAAGHLHYVHVACTEFLTAMHTGDRTKEAIDAGGVLPGYAGTIVRDGYKGYEHLTDALHAWCGAHGLRDLAGLYRFDPDGQLWARAMAGTLIDANAAATAARSSGQACLDEAQLAAIRARYRGAVAKGITGNQRKRTQIGKDGLRLARRFRACEDMILRFATDLTVGFTSNQAERDVRPVKVQMRTSGGCWRTLAGLADFAIVQSYLSTAGKWGIDALDALTQLFTGQPWLPPATAPP